MNKYFYTALIASTILAGASSLTVQAMKPSTEPTTAAKATEDDDSTQSTTPGHNLRYGYDSRYNFLYQEPFAIVADPTHPNITILHIGERQAIENHFHAFHALVQRIRKFEMNEDFKAFHVLVQHIFKFERSDNYKVLYDHTKNIIENTQIQDDEKYTIFCDFAKNIIGCIWDDDDYKVFYNLTKNIIENEGLSDDYNVIKDLFKNVFPCEHEDFDIDFDKLTPHANLF